MDKYSVSTFRWKKYLLPFFSAAAVMLMGSLIFFLPTPLATQFHETTAGQHQSVTITPEVTVEMDERSAISITNSELPSVELVKGNVYFDDQNTSLGIQSLEVFVGDVRVLSLGASFSLEMLKNGGRIVITNGQLELDVGGQVRSISTGQQIEFDKQRVIKESSIADLDVAPWRRL